MMFELVLLSQEGPGSGPAASPVPMVRDAGELPWARRPSVEFPERALSEGVQRGAAVLECGVDADGAFSQCRIASESPPRMGFGAAALAGARRARLDPTRWSEPKVTFSLRFAGVDLSD